MNKDNDENKVVYLRIDDIIPNRFQPREVFDEAGLMELADSIKEHGVIQPIIVRRIGDKYELIAGERRSKASSLAGLTTIPAIIKDMDDQESAKVSLLENLQRKNLSAIEEARTYKRILELDNMTQEELARTMGRSQPMVANKLRLLSLPEEIQDALMKNQISERHARSLLNIKNKKDQLEFLDKIRNERLTVRELDALIKEYKENGENISRNQVEESNDIFNERSNMNNNRSNFGGMGLNDYQSSVNNNMFNNIPNNFNNMANNVAQNNNTSFNYNNFDQNNLNNQSSLGSMFDNANTLNTDSTLNNDNNSNLFVSHIREDNLPRIENQFLPNFDTFNPTPKDYQSFQNTETSNRFEMNNNIPDNNNYNTFSSNPIEFNMGVNNQQFNDINSTNQNPNFESNFQLNNGFDRFSNDNNSYFDNNLYNTMDNNNRDISMNRMSEYNNVSNFVPEFDGNNPNTVSFNGDTYDNNGGLFNQPLNIVDIPRNTQVEYNQESNIENNNSLKFDNKEESEIGSLENRNENPFDDQYENILFAKPVPLTEDEEEQSDINQIESTTDTQKEDDNKEINDVQLEEKNSDIEIIGEIEPKEEIVSDSLKENEKNEYISLEPTITIKNTNDAVLELKKTTDKIKQNGIDIETEEIDFDDVYQITIKIKKTDL